MGEKGKEEVKSLEDKVLCSITEGSGNHTYTLSVSSCK